MKDWPFSHADFVDLRNGATRTFESFTTVLTDRTVMAQKDGTPEEVRLALVSPNFFQVLGGKIVLNSDFSGEDGQPQPNANAGAATPQRLPTFAILSHEYFERRYGGDPSIIGRHLASTVPSPLVVGVLAPGFEILFPPSANIERVPQLWIASRLTYDNAQRNLAGLHVIGKLKPGVTLDRAQAEADTVPRNCAVISRFTTPRAFLSPWSR